MHSNERVCIPSPRAISSPYLFPAKSPEQSTFLTVILIPLARAPEELLSDHFFLNHGCVYSESIVTRSLGSIEPPATEPPKLDKQMHSETRFESVHFSTNFLGSFRRWFFLLRIKSCINLMCLNKDKIKVCIIPVLFMNLIAKRVLHTLHQKASQQPSLENQPSLTSAKSNVYLSSVISIYPMLVHHHTSKHRKPK